MEKEENDKESKEPDYKDKELEYTKEMTRTTTSQIF
jgi:hypothetical protein